MWVRVDIDRDSATAAEFLARGVPRIDVLDPEGSPRIRLHGLLDAAELADRLRDVLRPSPLRTETEFTGMPGTPLEPVPGGFRSRAICWSNVGYGPLTLGSMSPLQSLRFGFQPRTPSTLAKDGVEVRALADWVNFWAFKRDRYLLDFEAAQARLSLAYGVTDEFQIDVELMEARRFGGNLDGLIQSFHDAVGIDQDHREDFNRGRFQLDFDSNPPVAFDRDDRGLFRRDLEITLQHNVTCGTEGLPALAWGVTVRTSLLDSPDLDGGGRGDAAFFVSTAYRLGDWHLYGAFGAAFFGPQTFHGIPLRSSQVSALGAAEWRLHPRLSVLLQYLLTSGVARDFDHFSDPSHELTIGIKAELTPGAVFEFGIVENLIILDNSPDFGVHSGLTLRF